MAPQFPPCTHNRLARIAFLRYLLPSRPQRGGDRPAPAHRTTSSGCPAIGCRTSADAVSIGRRSDGRAPREVSGIDGGNGAGRIRWIEIDERRPVARRGRFPPRRTDRHPTAIDRRRSGSMPIGIDEGRSDLPCRFRVIPNPRSSRASDERRKSRRGRRGSRGRGGFRAVLRVLRSLRDLCSSRPNAHTGSGGGMRRPGSIAARRGSIRREIHRHPKSRIRNPERPSSPLAACVSRRGRGSQSSISRTR